MKTGLIRTYLELDVEVAYDVVGVDNVIKITTVNAVLDKNKVDISTVVTAEALASFEEEINDELHE